VHIDDPLGETRRYDTFRDALGRAVSTAGADPRRPGMNRLERQRRSFPRFRRRTRLG
jgi:hypothetical protein